MRERDIRVQSIINQLKKIYTDLLNSNPPIDKTYLYREVAAALGMTITKIYNLQSRERRDK